MNNTRYAPTRKMNMRLNESSNEAENKEYREFVDTVVNGIGKYLPEKYADYEISIEKIPKNNGMRDSLKIVDPVIQEAAPLVYVDELYATYREGTPIDEVLQMGAAMFTYGMDYARGMMKASRRACERQDNIIAQMVNTNRNLDMLKSIPHTDYLDLSVIYRHYIALPDGTFNLATVGDDEQSHLGMEVEDLHKLALVNTRRILPVKREYMGEGVYILSNRKHLLGANALLYKGQLRFIARKCKSDIFLAASSIHEVMSIPVKDARLSFLRETVRDANSSIVSQGDVLSDTVYRYDLERDLLLPAWDDSAELLS